MQELTHLFQVPDVEAYFFDMYGVLWSGNAFYPHVLDVLERLRADGKKVYIISNQTVTKATFIAERHKQGLLCGVHYDDVITSGSVCHEALKNGLFEKITGKIDYRFYVLGVPNAALFEEVQSHQTDIIEKADVFYIGSIPNNSQMAYQSEFIPFLEKALARDLPALCANPDRFVVMEGEKRIVQGQAARWYREHGGRLTIIGKPFENIFEFALRQTGADKQKSVMVGDMLMTDIWGANRAGMRSVLVAKTGVSALEMQTQQIDLSDLIKQVASDEKAPVSQFEPTYCIPQVGSFQ